MQAPDIDAAALHALPNETKEALLQRLLEQKLRTFATQVSAPLLPWVVRPSSTGVAWSSAAVQAGQTPILPGAAHLASSCDTGLCCFRGCNGLSKSPGLHPQSIRSALIQCRRLQVKEGKSRLGSSWPARYAVNERAQSGLALIHILAALGYDWGLQLLLPLGAKLNLQVAPRSCWGAQQLHSSADSLGPFGVETH